MSFRGRLIKAGIDSNGTDIAIFNGSLTLQTDNKLIFRDSGIYIHSNADGYLTIEADTGVVIASDLTITGTVTYTGTFGVTGDLNVGGTLTVDGVTTGISVSTAATGITFSGAYTTAAIQIGTDASKLAFAAAADHAIDIATSCAATTGTLQCVDIEHTQTGASYTLKIEALRVGVASAVMTGDWCNAIVGVITYTAPGTAGGGMAAAICAEVNLAAQSLGGGTYTLFHGYLGVPTSCVLENSTTHVVSLARFEAGGGAVASFDSYGQLFQIVGLTAGGTKLISAGTHTAKVLVGSSQRYLLLSTTENCLTFGACTTGFQITGIFTKGVVLGTTGGSGTTIALGTLAASWYGIEISVSANLAGNEAHGIRAEVETTTGTAGNIMVGRFDACASHSVNTLEGVNCTAQILGDATIGGRVAAAYVSLYSAAGITITKTDNDISGLMVQHWLQSDPGTLTASYFNSGIQVSIIGGSYCEYGQVFNIKTSNMTACILISPDDSAVIPDGIRFEDRGGGSGGSVTNALYFDSSCGNTTLAKWEASGGCVSSETNVTFAGDGVKIAIDVAGTTYYLRACTAFS